MTVNQILSKKGSEVFSVTNNNHGIRSQKVMGEKT
jgi:hypothetical protein